MREQWEEHPGPQTPPPRQPPPGIKRVVDGFLPRRLFGPEIDKRMQMERQREPTGQSSRPPRNAPRTPPPREPLPGTKRTADPLPPQRLPKRPNAQATSPTRRPVHQQQPMPASTSNPPSNQTIKHKPPKWIPTPGQSFGGPSSRKQSTDQGRGSEVQGERLSGPSSSGKQ